VLKRPFGLERPECGREYFPSSCEGSPASRRADDADGTDKLCRARRRRAELDERRMVGSRRELGEQLLLIEELTRRTPRHLR